MRKDFFATKIKSMLIIAPEKGLIRNVMTALDLIKKTNLVEYNALFSRLEIVFVTDMDGGYNRFFSPRCWITNKLHFQVNDLKWAASILIHEGIHATQVENMPFEAREKEATDVQINFLKKAGYQKGADHVRRSYKEKYWVEMQEKYEKEQVYFKELIMLFNENKLNLTYL